MEIQKRAEQPVSFLYRLRGSFKTPYVVDSKRTRPIEAPGTTPGPPTRAAPMFEMIDPYLQ